MAREKKLFKRSVDFRPEQIDALQQLAGDNNRTFNYMVREAINQYVLLNAPELLPEDIDIDEDLSQADKQLKKYIAANLPELVTLLKHGRKRELPCLKYEK
jgi:predicted transcriptional regulator